MIELSVTRTEGQDESVTGTSHANIGNVQISSPDLVEIWLWPCGSNLHGSKDRLRKDLNKRICPQRKIYIAVRAEIGCFNMS